jgi:hypothetical protein
MIDTDDYLDSSPAAVGRRLEWSREALGFDTAREFRESFDPDMANPTFAGYTNGSRILAIDSAIAICKAHELTLDWLYLGKMGTLPAAVQKRIAAVRDALDR